MNLQDLVFHKTYIECGFNYLKQYKNSKILYKSVPWFAHQKMEYFKNSNNFVYGISFLRVNKNLWFDKNFHDKTNKKLLNSGLCRK